MGLRHLFFESEKGPLLEVKWGRVSGRFSHRKHLRRLGALHRNTPVKHFRRCPLPEQWKDALSAFEAVCFEWESGKAGGTGVVLYCHACGQGTLIQFFGKSLPAGRIPCAGILASFRDHSDGPLCHWSLYDFRALIPPDFNLMAYRFDPGAFTLKFESPAGRVTLFRWGPAGFLLQDGDLAAFAGRVLTLPEAPSRSATVGGHGGMEWISAPAAGPWRRLLRKMRGYPAQQWIRLWHEAAHNRILGFHWEGRPPLPTEMMEALASAYESI